MLDQKIRLKNFSKALPCNRDWTWPFNYKKPGYRFSSYLVRTY